MACYCSTTNLTLVLSCSSQTVEMMKTAAMMTTTFAQEPGNMEDTMFELRLSCPIVFFF